MTVWFATFEIKEEKEKEFYSVLLNILKLEKIFSMMKQKIQNG